MNHDPCTVEEIRACAGDWIFCDGGVLWDGKGCASRSDIGAMWAWILVRDGQECMRDSGVLTPTMVGLDSVTNNISELYAMIRGLAFYAETHERCFEGTLVSDSRCTLSRRWPTSKMKGVPEAFIPYARQWFARALSHNVRFVHVGGHPNPKALKDGRDEDGDLVSVWNKAADKECGRIGALFTKNRNKES